MKGTPPEAPNEKMKEPSPLVPQGSFEAQARTKSRVKLAFYTIVAIHVLAICGFLIIGCKRDDKDLAGTPDTSMVTNEIPPTPPFNGDAAVVATLATNTNPPGSLTPPPLTNPGALVSPPPLVQSNPATVNDVAAPAVTEHTIVKGDFYSTLATKYGVTVKAIQAANPGKDPSRLQIGDKIKIPAKTAAPASTGTTTTASADPSLYTVKSGDTLGKIAKDHKTTVSELQKLNNLSTTQIKVGQKLKMPSAGTPPPAQ
jgi:LysM repeat protein